MRSTGGDPASGLACTAASQSWADGHGRPGTPACASADRKSTHTEPPRSARTAIATASATTGFDSSTRDVSRRAT